MDQIQIARLLALLTILPPDHPLCGLVQEFAQSDLKTDLDNIDAALRNNNDLKKRIDDAAFAVSDYLYDWEADLDDEEKEAGEVEKPTLVQLIRKIVA